ncbi:hypothetical protein Bca52824_081480 [Brassica carinata]|uniref:Uncharacterized protein n=1 Tax=Brassica carinata TaxID=52824 RepID=A0A8X7PF97_BRACI|nr:hypothetical protein Bca52824_081480 [Brassica carinata]
MVSPLLLVQIWLSRRRSRRLSVLWATLEDSDGSSLLSPPLIWSLSLFAPKWAVVVYFDKWQDDRWAFSLRTRLVLAALEVVYPFGSSVLYGLLVKSVSTV